MADTIKGSCLEQSAGEEGGLEAGEAPQGWRNSRGPDPADD